MIKISEILKGCKTDKIQSVGIMQVIPLVSELNDDRFSSPISAKIGTSGYGTLVVQNESDKTMIVPAQAAYVVKQAAQDHALPHVGIVDKKKKKSFNTAMCIQQTQGGYISSGEHKMIILPFPLREEAHRVKSQTGYDRLWSAIGAFNKSVGVQSGYGYGHLEYFLDHFKDQLNNFVAEFEPVPNQVGAIILINGRVVGIERAPSSEYWYSVWPALIRECYGGLAIYETEQMNKAQNTKKGKKLNIVPKTRIPLSKVSSIKGLKKALKDAVKKEYDVAKEIVDEICDIEVETNEDQSTNGLTVESLGHKRFVGQIVKDGEKVVYGSVITTKSWRDNSDWHEAEEFKM